jgi:hypothetical protein
MDQLRALRYFSKVVETGSFTKAAATFSGSGLFAIATYRRS